MGNLDQIRRSYSGIVVACAVAMSVLYGVADSECH